MQGVRTSGVIMLRGGYGRDFGHYRWMDGRMDGRIRWKSNCEGVYATDEVRWMGWKQSVLVSTSSLVEGWV